MTQDPQLNPIMTEEPVTTETTTSPSGRSSRPRLRRVSEVERPPLRVTRRDLAVLAALLEYRVLSTPQIVRLFFSDPTHGIRIAQRRLQALYHAGFVQRVAQPIVLTDGAKPFLYLLDRAGADLIELTNTSNSPEEWTPDLLKVQWWFLEHRLSTNDVRLAIELACRESGLRLDRWVDDDVLRKKQNRDYVELPDDDHRRVAVIPDGYFRVVTGTDAFNFLLEIDRRTVTGQSSVWGRRTWQSKVEAYLAYWSTGVYEKRYGTRDMRVLTVTTGERRMRNLLEITERVAGGRFWFTTFEALTPDTALRSPIWSVARKEGKYSLIG